MRRTFRNLERGLSPVRPRSQKSPSTAAASPGDPGRCDLILAASTASAAKSLGGGGIGVRIVACPCAPVARLPQCGDANPDFEHVDHSEIPKPPLKAVPDHRPRHRCSGGVAAVVLGQAHIDAGQFGRMAGPERGDRVECDDLSFGGPPQTCSGVQIGPAPRRSHGCLWDRTALPAT